jgi:hypothetical protein
MIDRPGCYDLPAADYHADPCPAPSLSAGVAHVLLSQSPWHAWTCHPRLNPAHQAEHAEHFDVGTAVHGYLLEGDADYVIVEAEDWRTKAARTARVDAWLAGKTPLLAAQWAAVQAMAAAARRQLANHQDRPTPLTAGKPEQTLIWQEAGVWCRARPDWLHDDHRTIDDLKTTSGSANPAVWARGPLFANGYDIQAAWYLRGVRAVFGVEADFRFITQETSAPFALTVIGLGPDVLTLADKKVRAALELWRRCLETGVFPGYPTRTCYADLPPWQETRWLEQEYRQAPEPVAAAPFVDDGRPIDEILFGDH